MNPYEEEAVDVLANDSKVRVLNDAPLHLGRVLRELESLYAALHGEPENPDKLIPSENQLSYVEALNVLDSRLKSLSGDCTGVIADIRKVLF
jgi:hypothetical protein